jgi:hypothetical protein
LGPDHRPRKEMAEILKIFGDAKDGVFSAGLRDGV